MSEKKMTPLVTVVIPAYERAYILPRAISSVLKQTYRNIELIVVDDGSKDNTGELVEKIGDERVRYIRHDGNLGLPSARNSGIRNARGSFIALLDSDDEYLEEKIEKSVEVFLNNPENIGMVCSNYYNVGEGTKSLGLRKGTLKRRIFPHVSGWVLRKEIFDKIGLFDERLAMSEDVDFFQRLRRKAKFYFIEEPLFNVYKMRDGFFFDMKKAIERRERGLARLEGDRRLYTRHMKYLAKDHAGSGDKAKARECYLKAFLGYPFRISCLLNFLKFTFQRKNPNDQKTR